MAHPKKSAAVSFAVGEEEISFSDLIRDKGLFRNQDRLEVPPKPVANVIPYDRDPNREKDDGGHNQNYYGIQPDGHLYCTADSKTGWSPKQERCKQLRIDLGWEVGGPAILRSSSPKRLTATERAQKEAEYERERNYVLDHSVSVQLRMMDDGSMTDQELTESVSSHKRDDLAKLREDARNAALSGRGPTYRDKGLSLGVMDFTRLATMIPRLLASADAVTKEWNKLKKDSISRSVFPIKGFHPPTRCVLLEFKEDGEAVFSIAELISNREKGIYDPDKTSGMNKISMNRKEWERLGKVAQRMIRRDIPARLKRTPIFPPAGGPVWNQKVKGVAAHSVAAALMNHFTPQKVPKIRTQYEFMDQDDKDDWRREVLDAVRELDPTFLTAAIIDEMGKKLAAEGCGGALKDAPIALIGGMVSQFLAVDSPFSESVFRALSDMVIIEEMEKDMEEITQGQPLYPDGLLEEEEPEDPSPPVKKGRKNAAAKK